MAAWCPAPWMAADCVVAAVARSSRPRSAATLPPWQSVTPLASVLICPGPGGQRGAPPPCRCPGWIVTPRATVSEPRHLISFEPLIVLSVTGCHHSFDGPSGHSRPLRGHATHGSQHNGSLHLGANSLTSCTSNRSHLCTGHITPGCVEVRAVRPAAGEGVLSVRGT